MQPEDVERARAEQLLRTKQGRKALAAVLKDQFKELASLSKDLENLRKQNVEDTSFPWWDHNLQRRVQRMIHLIKHINSKLFFESEKRGAQKSAETRQLQEVLGDIALERQEAQQELHLTLLLLNEVFAYTKQNVSAEERAAIQRSGVAFAKELHGLLDQILTRLIGLKRYVHEQQRRVERGEPVQRESSARRTIILRRADLLKAIRMGVASLAVAGAAVTAGWGVRGQPAFSELADALDRLMNENLPPIAESLAPVEPEQVRTDAVADGSYVQVGTFSHLDDAERARDEFARIAPAVILNAEMYHVLVAEPLADLQGAVRDVERRLKDAGYDEPVGIVNVAAGRTEWVFTANTQALTKLVYEAFENMPPIEQLPHPQFIEEIAPYIDEARRLFPGYRGEQVPRELYLAIMLRESDFHPEAVSKRGARGLMQVMPYMTKNLRKWYPVLNGYGDDLMDPKTNIMYGGALLGELHQKFTGDILRVLGGYNAGESAEREGRTKHFPETRKYKQEVYKNYNKLSMLQQP